MFEDGADSAEFDILEPNVATVAELLAKRLDSWDG